MALTENQSALLERFEPLDALREEIARSPEFCFSAMQQLYKTLPLGTKIAVVDASLSRADISFLQADMIAYEIIRITKEDRGKGIELIASAIRRRVAMDFGEFYLCDEIGPLEEAELDLVFSAFLESGRTTSLFEAALFLPKICQKDYTPLLDKMKVWMSKPEYDGLVRCLAEEISKYLYERNAQDSEWESLVELIKNDLASNGIAVVKERKNFNKYPEYSEFLLSQYGKARLNAEKIKTTFAKHGKLASLLPELKERFDANGFDHPLVWYLNDERPAEEAKEKCVRCYRPNTPLEPLHSA